MHKIHCFEIFSLKTAKKHRKALDTQREMWYNSAYFKYCEGITFCQPVVAESWWVVQTNASGQFGLVPE